MAAAPIAFVDDERFDEHRSADPHPERPERLFAARAALSRALPSDQRLRIEAHRAGDEEVLRVHTSSYVEGLREILRSGSGWGHIDADTFYSAGSEEAAWRAAGGAVDLVRALFDGRAQRGIALLRPPGHHACPSRAMGFCLLNNIAIAAADALARGADRIAIVDWDVHHGNGTQDAFYDDDRVLFVSVHQSPLYPGTGTIEEQGKGRGVGYTINVPMPPGSGPEAFGEAFREIVLPVLNAFEADAVLVSTGLDGHLADPLAHLTLDARTYGAMTSALVQHVEDRGHGRLALFLEGGYDLDAIEASFCAMLEALRGKHTELPSRPLKPGVERALTAAKHAAASHWDL